MIPSTFTATAQPMGLVIRPRYEIAERWPPHLYGGLTMRLAMLGSAKRLAAAACFVSLGGFLVTMLLSLLAPPPPEDLPQRRA